MQLLEVPVNTTLVDLTKRVGTRNVGSILHINDVPRVPNIGAALRDSQTRMLDDFQDEIDYPRKIALVNTVTQDSDIFEAVALTTDIGWKLMSLLSTLPGYLKIPESIVIPDGSDVLGNGQPIPSIVYQKVIESIQKFPHDVDPTIFNEYSASKPVTITDTTSYVLTQWFPIPWGEVTLHSSLSDEYIDFPVYPEELSDGAKANYTQMPDLLYQYEPWQLYMGSGPRSMTLTFDFHRDMWTGDHRDGKANELIRMCEACCYPEYRGSAVNTSTVTMYIAGKVLISGVMTDVSVDWDGPLGLDGWYLHCKLAITITEVAPKPLNYDVVKNKPLIG